MKDWKTTLLGILLAILVAIQPFVGDGGFDLKKDWMRYSVAIAIAIVGFFMKDDIFKKSS